MHKKASPECESNDLRIYVAGAFMGIGLVLLIAYFVIPEHYGKLDSAGEFGDMFGGVNALFSGLAFVGVIWAILLQKQELGLQRQELKDTRQELAGQREQLELQNSTFKQQAFDSVFFQMISLQNEILEGIVNIVRNHPSTGRVVLRQYYYGNDFAGLWQSYQNTQKDKEFVLEKYKTFYNRHETDLGHYFRNFYTLIKYVDESHLIDDCGKKQYVNIARSQLSSTELGLLFYNGVSENGREKFKPLLEKFSLLKNLSDSVLIDPNHKEWYEPIAFGTPEASKIE